MAIKRTILSKDKNVFIVKLNLEAGDFIPEHFSSAYVTATVTSGLGVFTIGMESKKISRGVFLDMKPFEKHSIKAVEPLEIIVHHITLNFENSSAHLDKVCGLNGI